MLLMLKAKQMFSKCFITIRLKYIHDCLNIVVVLAFGREFLSAKCVTLPLTFAE